MGGAQVARGVSWALSLCAVVSLIPPVVQKGRLAHEKQLLLFRGTDVRTQPLSTCCADSATNLFAAPNPVSLDRGF